MVKATDMRRMMPGDGVEVANGNADRALGVQRQRAEAGRAAGGHGRQFVRGASRGASVAGRQQATPGGAPRDGHLQK